jgi:hypothetical protein
LLEAALQCSRQRMLTQILPVQPVVCRRAVTKIAVQDPQVVLVLRMVHLIE